MAVQFFLPGVLKFSLSALADVVQWLECRPVNQKVACSTPSQGTCLGCGPGSQLGACEWQPIDISLPLSSPRPRLKNK